MTTKFCPRCKTKKPTSEFNKDNQQLDGITFYCRDCIRKSRRSRYAELPLKSIMVSEKFCPSCKTIKPADEFYCNRKRPDGLQSRCKECHAKAAHTTRIRENGGVMKNVDSSAYQEKVCSKCGKKKPRKDFVVEKNGHINTCKMCIKEKQQKWRDNLPIEKKEQHRHKSRQYRKDNPERMHIHDNRRRSLKEHAEGMFTKGDIAKMKKLQGGKCLCCGKKGKLTIDHIIPLSKGGTNNLSNLQLLCQICNIKKYTKTKDYRSKALLRKLLDVGELF